MSSITDYVNPLGVHDVVARKSVHDVVALNTYQLVLQNLYAEVEAEVGLEKTKLNAGFAKRLSREYPGSFLSPVVFVHE